MDVAETARGRSNVIDLAVTTTNPSPCLLFLPLPLAVVAGLRIAARRYRHVLSCHNKK
jgi:hypothetical protein